ncbi:hypothetical protein [Streptomyces sp. NPDC023588]
MRRTAFERALTDLRDQYRDRIAATALANGWTLVSRKIKIWRDQAHCC